MRISLCLCEIRTCLFLIFEFTKLPDNSIYQTVDISDFERSYKIIEYYRNCEERSNLVSKYATFHFFFPTNHMPETLKNISFSCDEILNDPLGQCPNIKYCNSH